MSAAALITDLQGRGVQLWVEGSSLRFRAPRGRLEQADRERLAAHKQELMALLTAGRQRAGSLAGSSPEAESSMVAEARALGPLAEVFSQASEDPYVRHVAPYRSFLLGRLALDKSFVEGEGCFLVDDQGERYGDFVAQYGAVPFGHDPAMIWAALDQVRRRREPNHATLSIQRPAGELAAALLEIAPPGLAHVTFTNSGAEAVEVAFKLARAGTGRLGILSTRDGFHGLTLGGMSATGRQFFQGRFGAPAPGFDLVPFGDLVALQQALAASPEFYAALIVEPIQGEGGIHVAPPGYLAAAQELCRRYGVLLIVDEVQTGLGRTGAMFACTEDDVAPDVLLLAKALGGGLVSIGACLFTHEAYSEHFDLRHSSTFAGNTIACRAALASIEALLADDSSLVRSVARTGRRLRDQLLGLAREYPELVAEVRGRGLMLGVELDLDALARRQAGLLACMHEQGLLTQMAVSYLLNVEHARVAVSIAGACVIRIEPPLIIDDALCDSLVAALRRLLAILDAGDAGRLLSHLVRAPARSDESLIAAPLRISAPTAASDGTAAPFAFVVHLLSSSDLYRFDPSLARFSAQELTDLIGRIAELMEPCPIGELVITQSDGCRATGELILLPFTADELIRMPGREAIDLVQKAVELAAKRGAAVVGLGGFSSIIADGGLALAPPPGVTVTSGNSLTAWTALRSIEADCDRRGVDLAGSTLAIVGATGAIGHALSLLCAERVGRLILVGKPGAPASSLERLREIARDCARHISGLGAEGAEFAPGSLADRLINGASPEALLQTTSEIDRHLPGADVVITATNATAPFITASQLAHGAVICDVSRPVNFDATTLRDRPDIRVISGGLLQPPGEPVLGVLEDPDRPRSLVACASETVVLALSGYRSPHLCGRLDTTTVEELGQLSRQLGFSVACD